MKKKQSGNIQNPIGFLTAEQITQLWSTLSAESAEIIPADTTSDTATPPVISPDRLWAQWSSSLKGHKAWEREAALQTGILMSGMVDSAELPADCKKHLFQQIAFKLLDQIGSEWEADVLQMAVAWCPAAPAIRWQLWGLWRRHLKNADWRRRQVAVQAAIRLESCLRNDPSSTDLCLAVTEDLIRQLSVEQEPLVLLEIQNWVPVSFPVEDTSGRGQWSRTLPAACLWSAWESHLTGHKPQNRLTAFCAGLSLLTGLSGQAGMDRLVGHITNRLLGQLDREHPPSVWWGIRQTCLKWPATDPATIAHLWEQTAPELKADDWMRRELAIRAALQWETGLRNVPGSDEVRESILEQLRAHLTTGEPEYSWGLIADWSPPDVLWAERFWQVWELHLDRGGSRNEELSLTAAIVMVEAFAGHPSASELLTRLERRLQLAMDGCHDWSGWEILSRWCPTTPALMAHVWLIWKHHLTGMHDSDWRKQEAAVRAGIRLESALEKQLFPRSSEVKELLADIQETLLGVIARAESPWLLLTASRWQPQHGPTAVRLQELWRIHSHGKWDIQDIAHRVLARTGNDLKSPAPVVGSI